jgi:hypothetical protein
MKRFAIPLVMGCAVLPTAALAQFVITAADMPQPGVTYPVENAVLAFADYAAAGENVTWDMSGITSLGAAPVSPLAMSEASITANVAFNNPFNASYQCDYFLPTDLPALPDAIGINIPLDGFNSFYQTSGGHFGIAGIGLSSSGFDLPVQYDDIDEWFPLPFAYGESFNSSGAFELNIPELFGYAVDQTRSVTADAWGTLILPNGSYDVLRIRTELEATDAFTIPQIGTDPISVDRSQVIYSWYGANTGLPLLEVTETFGIATTVTFQNMPSEPNHVAESSEQREPMLAPNPSKAGTFVSWGMVADWTLHSVSGEQLAAGRGRGFSWPHAGIYVVRFSDGKTQKLVVAD